MSRHADHLGLVAPNDSYFANAGVPLASVDLDGRHLWWNEDYSCFLGGIGEDLPERSLLDALGRPSSFQLEWERAVDGHRAEIEFDVRLEFGVVRNGVAKLVRFHDEERGEDRVAISIQDLTAARRALADLQRYASMVAYSMDAIISLEPSGMIATWNAGAQNLYGYTADDVLGRALTRLAVPESEEFLANLAERVMDGEVVEAEVRQMCRGGHALWISIQASPIYHRIEGISGVLIIARDLTERRRMEEDLRAAMTKAEQAAVAKSRFLANMSHEIRTPMNGILGMTDLLLDTGLTEEQRQFAETVKLSGSALLELINDILDFSKIEAGGLEIETIGYEIADTIDGVLDVLGEHAARKGLELTGCADLELPSRILGDPVRLRQVLLNLANNAIKFTNEGSVALRVYSVGDGEVQFEVEDTGIGIPEDRMDRLFRAFSQVDASTTRRFGGTGLGLAICKELVELMGGRLRVESVVDQGSKFWFRLPLRHDVGAALPTVDIPAFLGLRVLVVDDVAESREIVSRYCTAWGCHTVSCADAASASKVLAEANEVGEAFSVVLLDNSLNGTSGLTIGKRWREQFPQAPTSMVLMTSYAERKDAKRAREFGFDIHLLKPVKRRVLQRTLLSVVGLAVDRSEARGESMTSYHSISIDLRRRTRILVAEDNLVNQKVVLKMLERLGYRATVAANGKSAVNMFTESPFDIVFMDCQMPEMDGYQATAALRALDAGADVPIVAMTANAMVGDREECLAAGMSHYLPKPISARALVDVLEEVFDTAVPG